MSVWRMSDDHGNSVVTKVPNRVVSLVPSLTQAIARSAPGLLVGATKWCIHPADLQVRRLGGTKNPDLPAIIELNPDLVVVNEEENRLADVEQLQAAGLSVWVTDIRTVDQALDSLDRLLAALAAPDREWLAQARSAWQDPSWVVPGRRLRAVIPIWRRPWMALGSDTYAGDVLARLGIDNVLAGDPSRYPTVQLAALPPVDLVALPDEPYAFSATDGPEAFPATPVALLDGRSLTWYGPSMVEAPDRLLAALRTAVRS